MQKQNKSISEYQMYLFNEGTNYYAYNMLGAHPVKNGAEEGYRFAVWAPNASSVSVVGEFNNWNSKSNVMTFHWQFGVWEAFVSNARPNMAYKYYITTQKGSSFFKADPYAFHAQLPSETASVTANIYDYAWNDKKYISKKKQFYDKPMSIYEIGRASCRERG